MAPVACKCCNYLCSLAAIFGIAICVFLRNLVIPDINLTINEESSWYNITNITNRITANISITKQKNVLYIFLNGGARKQDFLTNVLLQLQQYNKDYLIFSDEMNYNLSWTLQQKSHHVRVSTNHLKYLLTTKLQQSGKDGKALMINYMWTQIFEYLIDNTQLTQQYKSFIISENDIKICNQSLLDEFIQQFINDSNLNVMHLWDSCTLGRIQPIAKKWGRFHLIQKKPCGGVSTMIKPSILKDVLQCLYKGKNIEKPMDGQDGGFKKCKMLTYYPNEILVLHTGRYTTGLKNVRVKSKDAQSFFDCNKTVFYTYDQSNH